MSVRAPDGPAAKNAGASEGRNPARVSVSEGPSVGSSYRDRVGFRRISSESSVQRRDSAPPDSGTPARSVTIRATFLKEQWYGDEGRVQHTRACNLIGDS